MIRRIANGIRFLASGMAFVLISALILQYWWISLPLIGGLTGAGIFLIRKLFKDSEILV